MPWFRLDDEFHSHPKVLAAGNAAIGLYVRAGTYCNAHLTDGFVPAPVARSMGTRKDIAALVTATLWAEVDGGYRFPDFLDFNPSREKVLADREAAKERMAAARSKKVRPNTGGTSRYPDPVPVPVDTQVLNHPPKLTARGRARGILETYGARMVASALAAGEHVISESGLAVYKANQAQPRLEAAMERYPDAPDHAFVDYLAGSTGALEGYRPRSSLADAPADPPSDEFKAALRLVRGELRTEATA